MSGAADAASGGAAAGHDSLTFNGFYGTRLFDDNVYFIMLRHKQLHSGITDLVLHLVAVPLGLLSMFVWLSPAPRIVSVVLCVALGLYSTLLDWLTAITYFGVVFNLHRLALYVASSVPYAVELSVVAYVCALALQLDVGHRRLRGHYAHEPHFAGKGRHAAASETLFELFVAPACYILQGLLAMGYHGRLGWFLTRAAAAEGRGASTHASDKQE